MIRMQQSAKRTLIGLAMLLALAYSSACKSPPPPAPVESPSPAPAAPTGEPLQLPKAQGFVSDFANKLSPEARQILENHLKDFADRGGIDLAVVTISFDEMKGMAMEDYSLQLGRQWGIGRGPEKLGVLLLIAIKPLDSDGTYHGGTRLEISRNLERDIPNDVAQEIIRKMRDDFQAGRFDQALTRGVDEIISTLTQKRGIPATKRP